MKKEKQENMETAEAGAHDLFVVLTMGERGSMETLKVARQRHVRQGYGQAI